MRKLCQALRTLPLGVRSDTGFLAAPHLRYKNYVGLTALAALDPVHTRFHDITALGLAEITRAAH